MVPDFLARAGLAPSSLAFWLVVAALVVAGVALLRPAGRRKVETLAAKLQTAEIERARAETLASGLEKLEAENAQLKDDLEVAREAAHKANAHLLAERRAFEARKDELVKAEKRLEEQFAKLAGDALGKNSAQLLALVSERFQKHHVESAEDLTKRQKAIEQLVAPVAESLTKVRDQIQTIEKERAGANQQIAEQIRAVAEGQAGLKSETQRLVQALRQPKTRGRWGEIQLRNVLEMAGMTAHVDFVEQSTLEGESGKLRPDVVIHLPGGKSIVVDAKTPLDAYLDAVEAESDEVRARHLERHGRQLKEHVRLLSSKQYWAALPETPDFVVMFLPGEAIYAAAWDADRDIFENSIKSRVLISTPITFVALVRSIAYGWQQEKLTENARRVAETAGELFARLSTFGEHMDKTGRGLKSAVENYNRALASLESRVLPTARRFSELGVVPSGSQIEIGAPIETEPRDLQAPELIEGVKKTG
ncbi:MAG TPA: DNA recombination protein RmuC [Parvularculaceae bacterium]|nr:DNA recombination protein RmuC [Parvularculaceae bacterium]